MCCPSNSMLALNNSPKNTAFFNRESNFFNLLQNNDGFAILWSKKKEKKHRVNLVFLKIKLNCTVINLLKPLIKLTWKT